MEIKLNIYKDNTSKEPMHTYICYGFSFDTIIKFEEFQTKSKDTDFKAQMELILEFLRNVFSDFKEDHLKLLRPNDLHDFMLSIGQAIKGEYGKAEKN